MTGRLACFAAGTAIGIAVARRLERSPRASDHVSWVEAAAAGMLQRARHAVGDVVADGRAEMRQREARLRMVLAAPDDGSARRATQAER